MKEILKMINKNQFSYRLFVVVLATVFMAACSSGPRIITNSDPSADWSQLRTFGFYEPLGTDQGSVRSLISNQLLDSTTREMENAGFARSDSQPDLLINFVLSTRETLQTRPSSSASVHHGRGRYGTWSGWSMSGSTTEVVQRTEGTLGIDIIDRARNQLVWEGAASQRVTDSTRRNQAEVLDAAVMDIFMSFP
jgi:hypothetical protein